jgi:membrane-associated phospholipid phosphatase
LYVGAHLPLDAIGGSALGLAVGSMINLAIGAPPTPKT